MGEVPMGQLYTELTSSWRKAYPHLSARSVQQIANAYWHANKNNPGAQLVIKGKIAELNQGVVLPKGQPTLNQMWQQQQLITYKNRHANALFDVSPALDQNNRKRKKKDEKKLNERDLSPIVITIEDDETNGITKDKGDSFLAEPLVVLEVVVIEHVRSTEVEMESKDIAMDLHDGGTMVQSNGEENRQQEDFNIVKAKADQHSSVIIRQDDRNSEGCIRIKNMESLIEEQLPSNPECILLS